MQSKQTCVSVSELFLPQKITHYRYAILVQFSSVWFQDAAFVDAVVALWQAESAMDRVDWIDKITGVIASLLNSQIPQVNSSKAQQALMVHGFYGLQRGYLFPVCFCSIS